MGICLDVSSKYVSRFPLPTKISQEEFKQFRGATCLYEYGNRWYEIKVEGLNDMSADELTLPNGLSLFEEVHRAAGAHKSQNLLTLPKDCSVLIYYTTFREPRNVPSGLCRLTYGTNHPNIRHLHSRTIKQPHLRRREIRFVVDRYFRDLTFGTQRIDISQEPVAVENRQFEVPDLLFGNNNILSVRNSENSTSVSLEDLGAKKKELLYSDKAGPFTKKPFDRQYLMLPRSVSESFGKVLEQDIKSEVQLLFQGGETSYSPVPIIYDDSVQKGIYTIGKQIINAVEDDEAIPGFALVMIPEIKSKRMRKEDELGNLVMCELHKREIYASVIHTTVSSASFESVHKENEGIGWMLVSDRRQQSRYKGYIKNVVLNKILILNSFWPFVLKTPLHGDLIIGIDVKNNTAGFTTIHKNGRDISFDFSETSDKEELTEEHIRSKIVEIIRKEQSLSFSILKEIVIHRQGRLFPQEKEGILEALERLKRLQLIPADCQCTFVEIRTTSRVPFRLFNVSTRVDAQREWIDNPTIGTYVCDLSDDAFVCNTGSPYMHAGTTKPLHIIKEGPLSIENVLEDVFFLSNLTFTKIDDCARQPLSVKMTDIRLREIAGEYDLDALRFGEEE